jgi:hypothetical protein
MDRDALLKAHGLAHKTIADASAPTDFARAIGAADNYPRLTFGEIYETTGIIGLRLGAKAKDLAGQPVVIKGYMAPPLVDEGDFFVMTRAPVVTCPFCDFGASWPDDIVLTQLEKPSGFVEPFQAIEVAGVLDLGAKHDPRTGALRLVRLKEASWRIIPKAK